MKTILITIIYCIVSLYRIIKNLYVCVFNRCLDVGKYLILKIYGEEMLNNLIFDWYTAVNFYTTLWYRTKKQLLDTIDILKLKLIWEIKRSNNYLIKCLKNYLNKYSWFKNNIVKF